MTKDVQFHYATQEDIQHGFNLKPGRDPERCCIHCGSLKLMVIDADELSKAFGHVWYAEWFRCRACKVEFMIGHPLPPDILHGMGVATL